VTARECTFPSRVCYVHTLYRTCAIKRENPPHLQQYMTSWLRAANPKITFACNNSTMMITNATIFFFPSCTTRIVFVDYVISLILRENSLSNKFIIIISIIVTIITIYILCIILFNITEIRLLLVFLLLF